MRTPTRQLVIYTVFALVFVAGLVELYRQGHVALIGLPVALAVVPLILAWRTAALARTQRRAVTQTRQALAALEQAVAARPGAAALDPAGREAVRLACEQADKQFAWADERGAHSTTTQLVDLARRQGWSDPELKGALERLEQSLSGLDASTTRLEAEARRRGR